MCGHAGMAGFGTTWKDLEAFTELLYFTAVRGPHSTGLMTYDINLKYPEIKKRVGPSSSFIAHDNIAPIKDRMLDNLYTDVFMGHCRWATVGAVTVENAHPFDTGRYVSCHNGTLVDKEFDDKEKTDSELMFRKMETEGVVETLSALDEKSAFATVLFDKKTKTLNFARNWQRDLYFGICKERNVMYWSSEYEMLKLIDARKGLKLDIYQLEPFNLYTIKIPDIKGKSQPWSTVTIPERKVKPQTNFVLDIPPDFLGAGLEPMGPTTPWEDTDRTPHSIGSPIMERDTEIDVVEANKISTVRPEVNKSESFSDFVDKIQAEADKVFKVQNERDAFGRLKGKPEKPRTPRQAKKFWQRMQKQSDWCCVCGGEILARDKFECEEVEVDGTVYYSCPDCVVDIHRGTQKKIDEMREHEKKVG